MLGSEVEQSSDVSLVESHVGEELSEPAHAASEASGALTDSLQPHAVPSRQQQLLAEVQRLEAELERYRTHAQRTSKLFLSATHYAEWVRESARRDAENALRKARARVDALVNEHERRQREIARERERSLRELNRVQQELARLQVVTDETRARLSNILTAGIQVLHTGADTEGLEQMPDDELEGTLHSRLASASTSASTGAPGGDADGPERP